MIFFKSDYCVLFNGIKGVTLRLITNGVVWIMEGIRSFTDYTLNTVIGNPLFTRVCLTMVGPSFVPYLDVTVVTRGKQIVIPLTHSH